LIGGATSVCAPGEIVLPRGDRELLMRANRSKEMPIEIASAEGPHAKQDHHGAEHTQDGQRASSPSVALHPRPDLPGLSR
jgi:hypothetical protein